MWVELEQVTRHEFSGLLTKVTLLKVGMVQLEIPYLKASESEWSNQRQEDSIRYKQFLPVK